MAAVVVLLLAGLLLLRAWEEDYGRVSDSTEREESLTFFDGEWYRPRRDIQTVLLIGVDKTTEDSSIGVQGEYEQSDFLMLLVIDPKSEKCTGIHINRDTMTEIQILSETGRVEGRYTGQITLAHAYGGQPEIGCRNTVTAVSNLLYGVKINHYISITMDGVIALNDLIGGVTLEVMDNFSGIDDTLVEGETVTLLGQQALTYIRARHGMEDPTNLGRMERQKQYLEALQEQMLRAAASDNNFSTSALMELNDYIVSNCSVEQLSGLSETLEEYGVAEYRTLEGEAVIGEKYYEYYVDADALQRLVMELFYDKVQKE